MFMFVQLAEDLKADPVASASVGSRSGA